MSKSLKIPFVKFHGLGNDFIVARGKDLPGRLEGLARAVTDRHTGIGADGFIVVLPARRPKHTARVRFFNADGSEPEMSGNGIRCAAAYLVAKRASKRPLEIETDVGVKWLKPVESDRGSWVFQVGMGKPIFEPQKIPFNAGGFASPVVGYSLHTQRGLLPVTVTSMGNPHCTVFVADFTAIDWASLGREIERNALFPRGTNVEFVKVASRHQIEARFWERGVGQTMSSGTGSCGAVVASIINGLTGRRVSVKTLAGSLQVEWPEKGEVTLTGPVQLIAEGTFHYKM